MESTDDEMLPEFLIFVDKKLDEITNMDVPIQFMNNFGHRIASQLTLELPNGDEHLVTLKHKEKALYNVASLFKHNQIKLPATIQFWDYEGGKFKIFVLNENGTEMKYPVTRKSLSSAFFRQDEKGAAGWKFVVKTSVATIQNGEIVIPSEFLRRFRNILPQNITYSLTNGEQFQGNFSKEQGILTGLTILGEVNYINISDYLLFTYCTQGIFQIGVFDNSNVEKRFNDYQIEQRQKIQNHEDIINGESFSAKMLWSHVDKNSHGVLIPNFLKPNNRDWKIGETVIFRRGVYAWQIGIVYSNGKPRFCKGWNKFVRDNSIKMDEVITFTMQEEEQNIIFQVEFLSTTLVSPMFFSK